MGRRRAVLEQPAADLGERLRQAGRPELRAALIELIPAGSIGTDEHLPPLADRLARIAADRTLDRPLRDEAARLAAIAVDLPSGLGRGGVVWIAWWEPRRPPDPAAGHYLCHWEPAFGDDDEDLYEDGPDPATLDEALAWARRRTDHIIVRPSWDSGTYYWAGDGPCPDGRFPPLRP